TVRRTRIFICRNARSRAACRLEAFWSQKISIRSAGDLARCSVTLQSRVIPSEVACLVVGLCEGSEECLDIAVTINFLAMRIITTVAEVQSPTGSKRRVLVPTMGALHKAHADL